MTKSVMPMSKRHSHHRCKQRIEELSGTRLFEREWIYILPTSISTAIRSKLRFRKNMPFFGSVRYLFLRRKSATKDCSSDIVGKHRTAHKDISIYIFFFFEPRLEI